MNRRLVRFVAIIAAISSVSLMQLACAGQSIDPAGVPISDLRKIGNTPFLRSGPRVALVLGGGGTRGAAHVGALRALTRAGVQIDMIVGTSMGAIIGGLFSAGISPDSLQNMFEDGSLMRSVMNVPLTLSLATAPVRVLPRTVAHNQYDGLYNGAALRKYLDRIVPEYQHNIEHLRIPFAAVALNLVDGKPWVLNRGNLGYALQASSAVPGLREPVQIGNQLFVDGGVVDNIPVDVARAMGADIVIAVNVDERFGTVPLESFKAVGSVAKRLVTLQLASSDAVQLEKADFVIHPNVDGIGLISTKVKDARQAINAGEKAAWAVIPEIKERFRQLDVSSAGFRNSGIPSNY
ncbi:MAG: patatin-like phospholipase family protein [Candidatus Obscuribacterales bacterium]|nr:patatin-like phospholipase family protein [Candidatus Obscuribacterales bacterium]